jgi:hypothetical protein
MFLLLLVCESYYKSKISTEHNTAFIGGIFSVLGFVLLFGLIREHIAIGKTTKVSFRQLRSITLF